MNKEQIFGLLRTLGVSLMTYLVTKGTLTSDQATAMTNFAAEYGPGLVAAGLAAYGFWKKRDAGMVKSAGKVDGAVVVVNPDTASKSVVAAAATAPNNEVQLGKL